MIAKLFVRIIFDIFVIKRVFVLLLCILPILSISAQDRTLPDKDFILVINTYAEISPWSNRIISQATEFVREHPNLTLYSEHLSMLLIDTDTIVNVFKQTLFEKYAGHQPKMLLLLGNTPMMMRDDFRAAWGDIPIILCSEKDYVGTTENYLEKEVTSPADRIPISSLSEDYNLTFMHADLFIRENVEMMFHIIPNMKKFIFVSDLRYINQVNDAEIREILHANYPKTEYQHLSTKEFTVTQLIDSLNTIDTKTTGVMFASWFFKRTFAGNTSLVPNSEQIIASSSAPLFTLNMLDILNARNGMLGGYVYDQDNFNQALHRNLQEICDGKQARDIPFYLPSDGMAVLNYELLIKKGLNPSMVPSNTVFINRPPSFWEQYKIPFSVCCVGLFIIILLIRIRVFKRVRMLQQREINTMTIYKNLIDNMPIIYMQHELIKDESGRPIDMICRNVNTLFGYKLYSREEAIGKKFSELSPDMCTDFIPFIQMSLSEGKAITFPYFFKRINMFCDVVLKGTDNNNVVDIFCLDSTELHKTQKKLSDTNNKLAMALEIADIIPWKWDLHNKTILCDVNKPIELSIGTDDVNEEQLSVPDKQYFAKIHKEDRLRIEQAYKDLIGGVSKKVKEEYRVINIVNSTSRIEWVEAQAAVETYDEKGVPLTLVGSSQVITCRKQMELDLITAKNRAEESNRLKSAFLANMSHEIRTPLNAIVGFSSILASAEEVLEKQEYVSIIENNNTLLLQLISDILDLSKIEAGTLEYNYTTVELNLLIKEVESSLQLKMTSDRVQLKSVLPSSEKCFVNIEKNRLIQLLINLITNAIKFTEDGSVCFGYQIRGKELYFYVIDTGCGIPKDKVDTVFGRFVKLNNFAQGTGLGLSICQTLVKHMGGQIGVESEEGKGSTFWFTLPYESVKEIKEEEKIAIEPISVRKNKMTILVAEDNVSNYKLFESIFKHDYRILHAWDGAQAVELYQQYEPQVILMDINMPVMDGYEATRRIREYSKSIPIIAITAYAFASDEQRAMESGFDGFIPKPINAAQLKEKILDITRTRFILL